MGYTKCILKIQFLKIIKACYTVVVFVLFAGNLKPRNY